MWITSLLLLENIMPKSLFCLMVPEGKSIMLRRYGSRQLERKQTEYNFFKKTNKINSFKLRYKYTTSPFHFLLSCAPHLQLSLNSRALFLSLLLHVFFLKYINRACLARLKLLVCILLLYPDTESTEHTGSRMRLKTPQFHYQWSSSSSKDIAPNDSVTFPRSLAICSSVQIHEPVGTFLIQTTTVIII